MSQLPITVGPEADERATRLREGPDSPIVATPKLSSGCVSDKISAQPMNFGSVQRLQRFADVHQLYVDALVRVLRDQEDLARAVWGTLRAWRGGGSDRPSAVKRSRIAGVVCLLIATGVALVTGLPLPGLQ